jgi:hypothetical protein
MTYFQSGVNAAGSEAANVARRFILPEKSVSRPAMA